MQYNVILSSAWRCRRTWRVTPTRRSGPPGGDRITEQLRREILAEKRSGSDARSSQKNGAVQTRDPRRKTERFRREILTHTRRARARHHRSLHLRNAALFILSSGGGAVHARRAATSSSGSSSWRAGMRGRVVRRLVRSARRARRVTVVPFPRARRGASSSPSSDSVGFSFSTASTTLPMPAARFPERRGALRVRNRAAVGILRRVVVAVDAAEDGVRRRRGSTPHAAPRAGGDGWFGRASRAAREVAQGSRQQAVREATTTSEPRGRRRAPRPGPARSSEKSTKQRPSSSSCTVVMD